MMAFWLWGLCLEFMLYMRNLRCLHHVRIINEFLIVSANGLGFCRQWFHWWRHGLKLDGLAYRLLLKLPHLCGGQPNRS